MKTLFLFLFPLCVLAQTNYTENDISAAAEHPFQWLLTNTTEDVVDYSFGATMVQSYIYSKTNWEGKYSECGKNCHEWINENSPVGQQRKRSISYRLYYENLPDGKPISKKVVFQGDTDLILDFFVSYWTTDLDLTNLPKGEQYIARTQFLSDIATLTIDKEGNASITVITAKDDVKNKLSYNEKE